MSVTNIDQFVHLLCANIIEIYTLKWETVSQTKQLINFVQLVQVCLLHPGV